jgi:hypothetical protein
MKTHYMLLDAETYFVNRGIGSKETGYEDRYLVLSFSPRSGEADVARGSGPDEMRSR